MNDEPPRKVYDEEHNPTTGMGAEGGYDRRPKSSPAAGAASPDSLGEAESAGGTGSKGKIGKKESTLAGQLGKGFNPTDIAMDTAMSGLNPVQQGLLRLGRFFAKNKKKTIGGSIAGFIAAMIIFILGLGQGPLQLIHLSQILRLPSASFEKDNSIRATAMVRYWTTGDIGETRLTFVGSQTASKALSKLEANGVKFLDKNARGFARGAQFDAGKFNRISGQTVPEQQRSLARLLEIDPQDIRTAGVYDGPSGRPAGVFEVTNGNDIDLHEKILTVGLEGANEGKILDGRLHTANEARALKRYFGLPRLFSPGEKYTTDKLNKLVSLIGDKEAEARERRNIAKGREANYRGPTLQKIDEARGKFSPSVIGAVGRGLTFTGAACAIYNVAGAVAVANRAAIVAPSVITASHYTAYGDKIKTGGEEVNGVEMGLEAGFLTDKEGGSVWNSQPLNALYNPNAQGKDIDNDYKQAFYNGNVEEEILEKYTGLPLGIPFSIGCSKISLIAQGVAGALLTAFSCTAGAAATVGTSCAVAGTKFVGSSFASYLMVGFLSGELIDLLKNGDLDMESIPAEQRGALMAYAARERANMDARGAGGSKLSDTETTAMEKEERLAYQSEFRSKSFFARMFDVYDHRSLAGQAIQNINTSPYQNVSGLAANALNFGSVFSKLSSVFIPNTQAQTAEAYDWSFPRYGIPREAFNDPKFENPYANAEDVAGILRGSEKDHYIDKAKKCFGVEIKKDSNDKWAAIAMEDTNPATSEYHKSHCDENSENWHRIQLFVFDSRLMDSISCYYDDDESCENLEVGSGETSAPSEAQTVGDAALNKTIRVDSPGKFITMPSRYSCEGRTTRIDSRIAASLAYLLDTYDMCADDGLASGHKSHGAGLGVDIRPKDQSKQMSKQEWKNTVEKAARDMGWWGDSADEGKGGKSCAPAYSGYGQCVGGNGDIPKWVRWIGYNGDVDHGDPWHIFGGSYAHIHIGWASPNGGDAVASGEISTPIPAVLTFPAPVPDDLKGLIK